MFNSLKIILMVSCVFIPLTAWSQVDQNDTKDHIAIYSFEISGDVSEDEILIVVEAIRHELIKSNQFRVLGRDKMDEIMEEQKMHLSGICDESNCDVEIGKILSVEKIIGGSLRKVGSLYVLSARIYDVETGEILMSVRETYEGSIQQLLTITVKRVANTLTEGKGGIRSSSDLYVSSEPSGAIISIDGNLINNITPFVLESLSPGEHTLTLTKGNLRGKRSFNIKEGEFKQLFLPLANMGYRIRFRSPIGANFEIIGYQSGQVPEEVTIRPSSDTLSVLLHMPYHETKKISLQLTTETLITVNETLIPAGSIIIKNESAKRQSKVYLDNDFVGTTPYDNFSIPFGVHSVRIEGQFGEEDFIQEFNLNEQARDVEIIPKFRKKKGRLNISVYPIVADIVLDGNKLNLISSNVDGLDWGKHSIKATMTGYESKSITVIIDNSEVQDINIKLIPLSKKRAILYSALLPGSGNIYFGERKKGVVSVFIGMSFLASSLKFRTEYGDLRDQYNLNRLAYENAESGSEISSAFEKMKASFDKADSKKQLYDGLTAATALFWLYNVWDATRHRSPKFSTDGKVNMKNSSKSIYWDDHTKSLGLNILF